ncbi:response regulator [Synechocystis sp. PCC 7509]|uniref:response regulator n=1 Tax=Synechocystis sp. PCC 7509 TaxID=927677 RepID=UPI0002ACB76F|nr:response regulator [Synechocystis sp. PCC 7509]
MQGNLNEIDIRSILQLIEVGQRTGELFIEAYGDRITPNRDIDPSLGLHSSSSLPTRSWFIFFLNGQIIYTTDSNNDLLRLRDYLYRYQVAPTLDNLKLSCSQANNILEYTYLWSLLEHNFLTPSQGRRIIHSIIHETLFDLLSLHQGTFIFESGFALAPQLTTLKISSAVIKTMQQMQQWKQLHPHITSLHQCPIITDKLKLHQYLPASTVQHLEHWADGKTSLRQLARYLNRELVTVARAIYPFIQKGWVQLVSPPTNSIAAHTENLQLFSPAKTLKIACITEFSANSQVFKSVLSQYHQQIEAVFFENAATALSQVFQVKPDLIFCDLATSSSSLDGYEFCAMLRRSSLFRATPIIILSPQSLYIESIKARMLGATDYLVAPVTETQLLTLLEKYLNFPSIIDYPKLSK